jgi:type IV pilus assembly protein PilC
MATTPQEIDPRRSVAVPLRRLAPTPLALPPDIAEEENPSGFSFRATSRKGHIWRLSLAAAAPAEAMSQLQDAGLTVEALRPRSNLRRRRNRLPSRVELAQLADQFADQIEAGETPTAICALMGRNHPNLLVATAFLRAGALLHEGKHLHEAFADQVAVKRVVMGVSEAAAQGSEGKPIFPLTFLHALKIGEEIGAVRDNETGRAHNAISVNLRRFAEAQNKADAIYTRIRGALMYPAGVGLVALLITIGMIIFIVPKFQMIYQALLPGNAKLPPPTRFLVFLSEFLWSVPGAASCLALAALVALCVRWARSPRGSDWLARRYIFWPQMGQLLRDYYAAMLLRNLSMLAAGQSDVNARFRDAIKTTENPVYREMLEDVFARFDEQSITLDRLFRPYADLMGPDFHTVLLTYNNTGEMQDNFARYAQVMEKRLDRKLDVFVETVKTYAIIPVGVLIGGLVIALWYPLFDVIGKLANRH